MEPYMFKGFQQKMKRRVSDDAIPQAEQQCSIQAAPEDGTICTQKYLGILVNVKV